MKFCNRLLILRHLLNSVNFRGIPGAEVIITEWQRSSLEQLESCVAWQYGYKTAYTMTSLEIRSTSEKGTKDTYRMVRVSRWIKSYTRLMYSDCTVKWASPSAPEDAYLGSGNTDVSHSPKKNLFTVTETANFFNFVPDRPWLVLELEQRAPKLGKVKTKNSFLHGLEYSKKCQLSQIRIPESWNICTALLRWEPMLMWPLQFCPKISRWHAIRICENGHEEGWYRGHVKSCTRYGAKSYRTVSQKLHGTI